MTWVDPVPAPGMKLETALFIAAAVLVAVFGAPVAVSALSR